MSRIVKLHCQSHIYFRILSKYCYNRQHQERRCSQSNTTWVNFPWLFRMRHPSHLLQQIPLGWIHTDHKEFTMTCVSSCELQPVRQLENVKAARKTQKILDIFFCILLILSDWLKIVFCLKYNMLEGWEKVKNEIKDLMIRWAETI